MTSDKLHHRFVWPASDPQSTFAAWDRLREQTAWTEVRAIADAKAGPAALRALAERMYPTEINETATRWGMAAFMREVWCRAYMSGWRDAALSTVLAKEGRDE